VKERGSKVEASHGRDPTIAASPASS
jgi:hypothetical protein